MTLAGLERGSMQIQDPGPGGCGCGPVAVAMAMAVAMAVAVALALAVAVNVVWLWPRQCGGNLLYCHNRGGSGGSANPYISIQNQTIISGVIPTN